MRATVAHNPEEAARLAAAQAGDERAFRSLVEPYRRALEVHCYRMLGSRHDAEDTVQDTLLRAWRSIERFQRRSSVQTWLYRIATNACLDELERRPRRAQPHVEPYPDERLHEAAAPIADPAARYAQREGVELALLSAIQRLPGRQRAVLIMRDVLGWSGAEVAETLETTVAAVNSALQRARATLEQQLPGHPRAPRHTEERELLRRYVAAWESADIDGLVGLLREDAVLSMPPSPAVSGAVAIGEFLGGVRSRLGLRAAASAANCQPAVMLSEPAPDGGLRPHRLLVFDVEDGSVTRIHAFADPGCWALGAAEAHPGGRSSQHS